MNSGQSGSAAVREAVPAASRGNNLVLVVPPSARYAVPVLAGWATGIQPGESTGLLVAPAFALDEWAAAAAAAVEGRGIGVEPVGTQARAIRRLRSGTAHLLVASPESAVALLQRAALKAERVTRVCLAWPEFYADDEALVTLMQDLPKDSQRVLVTSTADTAARHAERYARRALVFGGGGVSPVASVRVVTVSWSERGRALRDLLQVLDPPTVAIWAVDEGSAADAARAVPPGDATVQVVSGDAPPSELVVAWDLPEADRLAQLSGAGAVVLLAAPHAAAYVSRVAPEVKSVRLPGAADRATGAALARSATLAGVIDQGGLSGELLALAPLLDRYDPALVAAAAYRLWTQQQPVTAAPAPPSVPAVARMWVGVGRKDNTTPDDIVAALTREVGVPRARIGRIEIRELYSLVELPAEEIEQIVERTTGISIRRRRVTARVDRGRTPGARPAKRGG